MPATRLPLTIAALCIPLAPPVSGQVDATLGAGVGTVRYSGGSTISIFSLGPSFQVSAEGRELSLGGTLAVLPGGDLYGHGRVAAWLAGPVVASGWRIAADLELLGASRGAGTETGAAHIIGEALWAARRWGAAAGFGPSFGSRIDSFPSVTALHTRARAWWRNAGGQVTLSGRVEPTHFRGAWFADIGAGVTARQGLIEARVWTEGRVSGSYASKAAASASALWRLSPRLSLEVGGGKALPDPYQGFPGSGFATAGLRWHFTRRIVSVPVHRSASFNVSRRADGVVLRVRHAGARTVAIAGDWNNWTPAPLTPAGADAWEAELRLGPGSYHFALLVDGSIWAIPEGAPNVPDGMGGRVAVLTVL